MSVRLYKRKARLLFSSQVSDAVTGIELETDGEAGLRVTFQVTRSTTRKANAGRIEIYNLNANSRAKLEAAGLKRVVLEAGYEDRFGAILCADRAEVKHARRGNDWVTTIEAGDGIRSLQTFVRSSYARRSTARQIVNDVKTQAAESTGLPLSLRVSAAADVALTQKVFGVGLRLKGAARASDVLGRVCRSAGCRVSIQDCVIEVLKANEAASGEAILLSPSSGLIEAPERVVEKDKNGKVKGHYLKGRSALMNRLVPSRLVRVESQTETATVLLTRVDHVGDTHGPDQAWVTQWEGRIQ